MSFSSIRPILVLFCLIGAILAGWFIIKPLYEEVTTNNGRLKTALEDVEVYQNRLDILQTLLGKYNNLDQEKKDKIYHILPTHEARENLLVELKQISTENGMIIDSIDFYKPLPFQSIEQDQSQRTILAYKVLEIALKTNGSYESFKNFLKSIENNLRILDVDSIKLGANRREDNPNFFSFEIRLRAYYQ